MIKLREYLNEQTKELCILNKEMFNNKVDFTVWIMSSECAGVNCVCDGKILFDFTIKTPIWNLEDNKVELLTDLNKISELIQKNNVDVECETLKDYDSLLKDAHIEITDIDI